MSEWVIQNPHRVEVCMFDGQCRSQGLLFLEEAPSSPMRLHILGQSVVDGACLGPAGK